jgi:hypothetical protein
MTTFWQSAGSGLPQASIPSDCAHWSIAVCEEVAVSPHEPL